MDRNKLWLIGSALVAGALLVFGWLLGIQPQLDSMHAANASRTAVQATNAGHVALLARLKRDFTNIDALTSTAKELAESVPSGSAMPALVDQLGAQAESAGLTLTGMTVTEARAYVPIVPVVAAAEVAGDAAPAAEAVAEPVVVAATGELPAASSQITSSNFAAFPLQITVTGRYAQVLDFVAELQSGGRLILVDGLDTAQAVGDPTMVDARISGLVYSLVAPVAASVG